jgi:ATP-dependent Clp protease protease subunit
MSTVPENPQPPVTPAAGQATATAPVTPARSVYVSFSGDVTPHTTESLIAVMSNCANQRCGEVYLMMATPRGSVAHGIQLYNVLRAMPFGLITHNVGSVNSIGNAVFLAGETRYACKNSTFMFHGVGFDMPQPGRLEEKFLREHLEGILREQNRIGSIIEERTSLTKKQIHGLFREAQTKDATYAIGSGIVHEIRDIQIPPGCPIVSLVFQR